MTNWLSNLFNFDDEEEIFVIDSNDRIIQRLNEYKDELVHKKEKEYEKRVEDFVNGLEYDEENKPIFPVDEEGYYIVPTDDDGYPLVNIDEEGNLDLNPPARDDAKEEPFETDYDKEELQTSNEDFEAILSDANEEAQRIIEDAKAQAEAIFEHSKEEGRQEGYNEGLAQGVDFYNQKQAELEEEKNAFLRDINAAKDTMEGELVDVICDVIEKAFKVQFSDSKEIILHLVDKVLLNSANSKVFIIRVSESNLSLLNDNKDMLMGHLGSDTILDIIADPLLSDESCMVETDGGVFNCGIDVQLKALLRDLRLLSVEL